MIRPITAGALCLTAAVSVGLYALSYEVQRLEGILADTNTALLKERELVQVLDAEWSYLNQPERLRLLAARHLDLVAVDPHQIAALQELPMRPDPSDDLQLQPQTPLPKQKPSMPMARKGEPGGKSFIAAALNAIGESRGTD